VTSATRDGALHDQEAELGPEVRPRRLDRAEARPGPAR
jgi:hypothetical protein